ncbi:unnamed protein product [Lathyrus oleraceus]
MKKLSIFTFPLLSLFFIAVFHMVQAQNIDISPAPTPTSDVTALDQGIAYLLMMVALVITYMLH